MRPAPPPSVREIARVLEEAGHPTWAVGGAVRDALLGRPSGDWDLATRARPEQTRRLFRRTVPVGIEHGTVGVFGRDNVMYEVTTFRRDVETFGRHAVVEFADTVEEDLARRDFTFNAVAWHPLREELLDPHGGAADLERRLLRTVGEPAERFAEDYLRVLRALRFAGHFEMEVETATWRTLVAASVHLGTLSAERVREELFKIVGKARRASRALSLYAAGGVLAVLYPELEGVAELDGEAAAPGPWTRSLLGVDALAPGRPLVRLAALLHAVGMPAARAPDLRGGWRHIGHEQAGARIGDALLSRLRFSNADRLRVVRLVRNQSALFPPDAPAAGIRRWLRDIGPDLVHDLFRLRLALTAGAAPGRRVPPDLRERRRLAGAVLATRPPLAVSELAIGGNDLKAMGVDPGPGLGQLLQRLLDEVLEDPGLNRREALMEIARREMEG
jgi:tRNA nucleotidyltransferase (CCA-adding enzyme)